MNKEKIQQFYVCDACHRTLEKSWSDEDANKEALELHGVENASTNPDMAHVCDDCFKQMRGRGLF